MTPKTIHLFDNEYYVIYNYKDLTTIWELQEHLSIPDSIQYNQLKQDIKQNGINDPILFYKTANGDKLVLDGHARLKACIELKVKDVLTKEITDSFESLSEIKFWMVKNQFQRRNLTPIEKLQLAYEHEEIIKKRAKENLSKVGRGDNVDVSVDTLSEIAKLAGIGRTTVARYKNVINSGLPNIVQKMIKGNLIITSAYHLVQQQVKDNINTDPASNVTEQTQSKSEQIQSEEKKPKYVKDIYEGKYLLKENEVEYLIMAKDQNKLDNFISQQPNLNCAIFLMED